MGVAKNITILSQNKNLAGLKYGIGFFLFAKHQ